MSTRKYARLAEKSDLILIEKQRVQIQLAFFVVLDRDDERPDMEAVQDPPDDIRGAVAEEERGKNLQLMVGLGLEWPRKMGPNGGKHVSQVAAEIREAGIELKVQDDIDQRATQPVLPRIVRAVGGRVGVDVIGRNRGADEQAAIVEIIAVQNLARHRIEESLGAFRLLVVDKERDVVALHRLPPRLVDAAAAEFALEPRYRLQDAAIIEVNAVLRGMGDGEPVAGFEMLLGGARAVSEDRVMAVEALERGPRDRRRVGQHGLNGPRARRWLR